MRVEHETADGGEHLDLGEAATELGVHYQTAYRWVRSGELRAVKVGKAYRVEREDLRRFIEHRSAGAAPQPIHVRDWGRQVDRLHTALTTGDERTASELVDRLVRGSVSPVDICELLVAPALAMIGNGWATGEVSVAEEHRATAICQRIVARLPTRRTRHRGDVVVTTPPGEHHALPALMAAVALRFDGWQVQHLASDLPADDLAAFLRKGRPKLLVLSVTVASDEATAAARGAAERVGVPVIVGGQGQTLSDLVESARRLGAG